MEHKALSLFSCAIEPVSHYRDSKTFRAGRGDPELVSAAGEGCELHQCLAIIYRKTLPQCDTQPAMNRVIDLIGPVLRVQPEGESQYAA